MKLDMIRVKNEIESSLLSITKNCEALFKETHRKPEEASEFIQTKPRETFHFDPPISIEGSGMVGLESLEVYISIFNITQQNNKFELH